MQATQTNTWDATVAHLAQASYDVDEHRLEEALAAEPQDPIERSEHTRALLHEVLDRYRTNQDWRAEGRLSEPFLPGLRPRGHESVLHSNTAALAQHLPLVDEEEPFEFIEPQHRDPGHPPSLPAVRLRLASPSRQDPPPVAESFERAKSEVDPATQALHEEARHNLHRLQQARGEVGSFGIQNRYQRELRALVLSILNYLEEVHCHPGQAAEFDRWWHVVGEYGRVLVSPEMASRRARTVLGRLLGSGHTSEKSDG